MNHYVGNPYNDAHGKALRCYEWTVPGDTHPDAILAAAELALGLKLCARAGDPVQHGRVRTWREDDVRRVHVMLFDACDDAECPAGHGNLRDPVTKKITRPAITYVRAADPKPAALKKLTKGEVV